VFYEFRVRSRYEVFAMFFIVIWDITTSLHFGHPPLFSYFSLKQLTSGVSQL
jgi:hypothetical protein